MYDNIIVICPECSQEYTAQTQLTQVPKHTTYELLDLFDVRTDLIQNSSYGIKLITPCNNCKTRAIMIVMDDRIMDFVLEDSEKLKDYKEKR